MAGEFFSPEQNEALLRLKRAVEGRSIREVREEAFIRSTLEAQRWVRAAAITLRNQANIIARERNFEPMARRDRRTRRNNFLAYFFSFDDRYPNPVEVTARRGRTYGQQFPSPVNRDVIIRIRELAECAEIVRNFPSLDDQRQQAAWLYQDLTSIYNPQTSPYVVELKPFSPRNPIYNGFDVVLKPHLLRADLIWRYFIRGEFPSNGQLDDFLKDRG